MECGTVLAFPRNDPKELGVPSGTYYDGTAVYPGTGYFFGGISCGSGVTMPGRIQTEFTANTTAGWFLISFL